MAEEPLADDLVISFAKRKYSTKDINAMDKSELKDLKARISTRASQYRSKAKLQESTTRLNTILKIKTLEGYLDLIQAEERKRKIKK